jgi:hypothetical protein
LPPPVAALAVLPAAAAALALRLARDLAPAERAVVAVGAALLALSAALAPQAPIHDAWTHYQHLREASGDARWLLDPWDRPGFTLLYAAPAALSWTAARLTSAAIAALAIAATIRAARAFGLATPWAAGVLLLAQHDFFGQGSSTMTELPFAAALAVALVGWAEGRPWIAAAGLAWGAVTRPEGPLFAAIGAAGLLVRHRRPGPPALALAALPAYAAAGSLAWGDPLWILNASPYRGLVGLRLEWDGLPGGFFLEALRRGQPPVELALLAAGVAAVAAAREGPARRLRPLLAPVAASFLLLTFLRIGEDDSWLESRYLVAIAPVLALLAAAGLDAALERFPRLAPPALLAAAALGAAGTLSWHWRASGAWRAGPAAAHALAYGLAVAAAAALWLARRRVRARAALAALLVLPLAASPPGAYGNLRPRAAPSPLPAAARAGAPATLDGRSAPWPTSS